jgi:HD-GYP domain-containing protein (c-di-GMP phosphodiesterase class II)
MGNVNKQLWLLLSLVIIAAILNFMISSQRAVLILYFLPTLYSAYNFGRKHATLTAFASVLMVVLLRYLNPTLFNHRVAASGENPIFDLAVWGGTLMVTGYAMGTLYERNQRNLTELSGSYDAMMAMLLNFLSNQKYSQDHSYRVSVYATKLGEALGMNSQSIEDLHAAALLPSVQKLGISNEMLYRAAHLSGDEAEKIRKGTSVSLKSHKTGGALRRIVTIALAEQALAARCAKPGDVPLESQVLAVADRFETLTSGGARERMSPSEAQQAIRKESGKWYDAKVVDAFVGAFGQNAGSAGAGH